ncbi:unnamed protein product [Acanthoscelides obtectus]|uniref:Uncharacterized protein n=1 Tax=Acanthoscelides obtectus TaxID=200917 RepID=A0A9P0PYT2_ACAOB|nr:unnamed protein product [Acanthoscelides obtectus]CAK1649749.1 hypothetical protein AOBTE_LOCUS16398 [Acanthoscelides obtectus]
MNINEESTSDSIKEKTQETSKPVKKKAKIIDDKEELLAKARSALSNDEYDIFSSFIAGELRALGHDLLKRKLKRGIQKLALKIAEEDEELSSLVQFSNTPSTSTTSTFDYNPPSNLSQSSVYTVPNEYTDFWFITSIIIDSIMSQEAIPYPESPNKTALALFHLITLFISEFFHIRESCTDPGQETSTLVNSSFELHVACTFILAKFFLFTYLSACINGFRIAEDRVAERNVAVSTEIPALLERNIVATSDEFPAPWGKTILPDLNNELAQIWSKILQESLSPEVLTTILSKYSPLSNLSIATAPKLNLEILSVLTEQHKQRDLRLAKRQDQMGAALVAIGKALTILLEKGEGHIQECGLNGSGMQGV